MLGPLARSTAIGARFIHSLLLAGLLFGAAVNSFGTTYYVDATAGNDAHNGTSTSSPWKTLTKVSVTHFRPGDKILLQRGDTWRQTLSVTSSGTSSARITYGAYGSGASPVLDQQHARNFAVLIAGKSYITITGLAFRNSVNNMVYLNSASNITIQSNAFKNAGVHGIYATGNSPGLLIDRNSYTMDSTYRMLGNFIDVLSSVNSLTVSNNSAVFSGTQKNAGIIVLDVNNARIFNNIVKHGVEGVGVKGYTRNVTGAQVYGNAIYDTRDSGGGDSEAIEFTGNTHVPYHASGAIFRNFVQGGSRMKNGIALVYAPNTLIYSNIVMGPTRVAAIHLSSKCPGAYVHNNTVYNAPVGIAVYTGSTATIRNNVVVRTSSGLAISPSTAATEDYNLFYNAGRISISRRGTHSKTTNPMFMSSNPVAANDFKIRSGSPAIRSGVVLSSPFQMGLDPADASSPYNAADRNVLGWTRGAFLFR